MYLINTRLWVRSFQPRSYRGWNGGGHHDRGVRRNASRRWMCRTRLWRGNDLPKPLVELEVGSSPSITPWAKTSHPSSLKPSGGIPAPPPFTTQRVPDDTPNPSICDHEESHPDFAGSETGRIDGSRYCCQSADGLASATYTPLKEYS